LKSGLKHLLHFIGLKIMPTALDFIYRFHKGTAAASNLNRGTGVFLNRGTGVLKMSLQ
jgi:hypothetical protein